MMYMTRRQWLKAVAATGVGLTLPELALAKEKRVLDMDIQGFSLGIHVPSQIAIREGLPELGYAEPEIKRIASMSVLEKSVIGGSAEIGESDLGSSLAARASGADVRLIGLVYNNTDQVFVINADKIKSFDDFKDRNNVIAINSRGDFIYVMLADVFSRHKVNINDTTLIEMGGSGSRMRALLAGHVAGVPIHIGQAKLVEAQGNFKILIKPWEAYKHFLAETWLVRGEWADDKNNYRAAVDLNKAMIKAFRRANSDYEYFARGFRKYATVSHAYKTTDEKLKPAWRELSKVIKAWPDDGGFKRSYVKEMLPAYRNAGAFRGKVDLSKFIETKFIDQALQELG